MRDDISSLNIPKSGKKYARMKGLRIMTGRNKFDLASKMNADLVNGGSMKKMQKESYDSTFTLDQDTAGQYRYQILSHDGSVRVPWQYVTFDRESTIAQIKDRFSVSKECT